MMLPSADNAAPMPQGNPAWQRSLFEQLSIHQVGGYHARDLATEPTALAALALLGQPAAQVVSAAQAIAYLNRSQAKDGSVGVRLDEPQPSWPTSLAVLAWKQASRLAPDGTALEGRISSAVAWILSRRGKTSPRDPEIGHNSELAAWSWADNTHSWIEPTALHVLALKAAGYASHSRVREAIAMLIDRQLPGGGCNYGNTYVLGQMLRPHLEPSGLLALALAGESDPSGRLDRTLQYLERNLNTRTTLVSLCWAIIGLAAHGRRPAQAEEWLELAFDRLRERGSGTHKLALLAHAALAETSPLVQLPKEANDE